MVRQGKTGATGPRGPKGARGATGAVGRRGGIGKPGPKGLKGLKGPLHKNEVLDTVVRNFEDVYQQLSAHLRQIAKMQRQLDVMSAAFESRTKPDRTSDHTRIDSLEKAPDRTKAKP